MNDLPRPPMLRAASLNSSLENPLSQGDLLECPICYGLLKDPVNGRCGHVFCKSCINSYFENRNNIQCPICRKMLDKDQIFPNLIARHLIGQCRITCPYAVSILNTNGLSDDSSCSCSWHGLIDDLKEHMKLCSLRPQQQHVSNISLESKFIRVPHPVISYNASHDANGGGTQGEFVHNLGQSGMECWNKWFSGCSSSNRVYTLTLTFAVPFKVHKYSLQSANDCINRSPTSWDLIGITADKQRVLLHSVQDELFESHWQTKEFLCTELSDILFEAVELKIKSTRNSSSECQLGRLFLFYAEEDNDNSPNPLHWYFRSHNRNGSASFVTANHNLVMFHFNPRTSERQIVMNTHNNNGWGHAERITLPSYLQNFFIPFEAFIRVTDVGYEVYFDGKLQYIYHHRMPWSEFNKVSIDDTWNIDY